MSKIIRYREKTDVQYLLDYLKPDIFGTEKEEALKEKLRSQPLSEQIIFLLVAEYGIKIAAKKLTVTPGYLRKLYNKIKYELI